MSEVQHDVQIALLQKEIVDLTEKVDTLSQEVAGLVDAWKTASGVVSFIKWLSGVVVAVGILWTGFRFKVGG